MPYKTTRRTIRYFNYYALSSEIRHTAAAFAVVSFSVDDMLIVSDGFLRRPRREALSSRKGRGANMFCGDWCCSSIRHETVVDPACVTSASTDK